MAPTIDREVAALGLPGGWNLSAGVGRGIDAEGLSHRGEYLANLLRADSPLVNSTQHDRVTNF